MAATASRASSGVLAAAKATVGAPWALRKVFSSKRSCATASARDKRPQRDWSGLAPRIRYWGRALGFDEIGIAGTDLSAEESRLVAWLASEDARWITGQVIDSEGGFRRSS